MDKPKIVFIVDDGHYGGLQDLLREAGERIHADIECIPLTSTLMGKRPDILVWDEHTVLPDMDFSKLESRISDMYDVVVEGGGTVTGRILRNDPELQELPDVSDIRKRLWDMGNWPTDPTERALWKDRTFCLRYGSTRKMGLSPAFAAPYGVNNNGADHPSRKREPKGPRGKWGKL